MGKKWSRARRQRRTSGGRRGSKGRGSGCRWGGRSGWWRSWGGQGSCCSNGRGRQLTGKRQMAEHGAVHDGRHGSKEDSRRRWDLEPLESIKDSSGGKGVMVKDSKGWGWWGGPSRTEKGRQIRKILKRWFGDLEVSRNQALYPKKNGTLLYTLHEAVDHMGGVKGV